MRGRGHWRMYMPATRLLRQPTSSSLLLDCPACLPKLSSVMLARRLTYADQRQSQRRFIRWARGEWLWSALPRWVCALPGDRGRNRPELHVPDDHFGRYGCPRSPGVRTDRHRSGSHTDSLDQHPGDQHVREPSPSYGTGGLCGWLGHLPTVAVLGGANRWGDYRRVRYPALAGEAAEVPAVREAA
jgi:hypothetical protein